jgi:acid phosphatase (class A)
MERGLDFGISRNVCNVHWHSDVVYGRMMGAAAVAALHANTEFIVDLEAAKKEVETLNGSPKK